MSKQRLLVISDHYPPDIIGGAELSLHEIMRALPREEWTCKVLTLNCAVQNNGQSYVLDGVEVHCFASRMHSAPRGKPGRLINRLRPMSDGFRKVSVRLYLELVNLLIGDRFQYRSRSIDHGKRSSDFNDEIEAFIRDYSPHFIHADSKNSILLLSQLDVGESRKIALVRDNRFNCSHPEHHMLVESSQCRTCTLECVGEAHPIERIALRSDMQQTTRRRRRALQTMDTVATTSLFLSEQLKPLLLGERPYIVSNPHPNEKEYERLTRGVELDRHLMVLFAGNLRLAKGPHILAQSFAAISDAVPGVRFVFAGRGPLEQTIIKMAAKANLSQAIELTGFLDRQEMFQRLAQASVVVAPNVGPEPFGRLPLECGIARKPIIASAIGGYQETIIHGQTGLLVPPNEPDALAMAVIQLLNDTDRRAEMGQAAYRHIRKLFAPEEIAKNLMSVWEGEAV